MSFSRVFLSIILLSGFFGALGQTADSTARIYYEKGLSFYDHDKYDSALVFLEKARSLFTPGSLGEGKACHALGDIFKYVLYDFDKAEADYERALAIYEKEDPPEIRNLTRIYYNLATTNRSQGDHETALSWCLKAVDGSIAMNDNVFLERTYAIAGNIYRDMHKFDSAIAYYEKGVIVNARINKGRSNETLAGLLAGWGDASYQRGDIEDAIDKLTHAVTMYQRAGARDKLIYLHTVRLAAEVQIVNGNLAYAENALQWAENIRKELNIETGGPSSALYQTYGKYEEKLGDNISAYGYYQKALQATTTEPLGRDGNPKNLDKVDFKSFAYDALLAKAGVVAQRDALECYSIAEKLMVASRAELDTEEAKWSYVDANYRLYENILRTLYQSTKRDTTSLLYFMESSKSKSLVDALHEAELKKVVGRGDTLITALRNLRQQSLSLQHRINEKNEGADRDELIATGQQIAAVEAAINSKYPSYIRTKYEGPSVSLSDIKEKIEALDATFIEYFWGYDNIYALVISSDGTEFYRLGDSGEMEKIVSAFLERFEARTNEYSSEAASKFMNESHFLYTTLMSPFQNRMAGRKRLIIVPDGLLMQVPFETLVVDRRGDSYKQLSYLLNQFIVSYSFSGSYLTTDRKVPRSKPRLLAFGFTGGAPERSPEVLMGEIAGSETELIALNNKFPDGTFLYGAGVTEKNFKDNAANYDVLHLAVHGSGDTGEDYSATLYFRDKEGPEDGRLYWYELYNMNLRASLAVLSSCESGIGKTYRGEGMLSMANAFTFAGCDNIVMGLWKVDDQVSVKLMDTFYSELLDGMAIDEALAMAKRTYLASADQVSANPKLWGSLVAYGESPILRADEIPTTWVIAALTVLVAAIVLLVVKTRKK